MKTRMIQLAWRLIATIRGFDHCSVIPLLVVTAVVQVKREFHLLGLTFFWNSCFWISRMNQLINWKPRLTALIHTCSISDNLKKSVLNLHYSEVFIVLNIFLFFFLFLYEWNSVKWGVLPHYIVQAKRWHINQSIIRCNNYNQCLCVWY